MRLVAENVVEYTQTHRHTNPRRACAARVTVVVLCVCLSVSSYSRYEAARERYRRLQNYAILKGIFPETTALERYAVETREKANMHWAYRDLIRSLCVPWGLRKSQRIASIDSRMLSTTATSPCQTLRELLPRALSVSRMRSSPRGCTFIQPALRLFCY